MFDNKKNWNLIGDWNSMDKLAMWKFAFISVTLMNN